VSWGKEAVLADSGRAGEKTAGVGRVRSLAFLSILRAVLPLSLTCGPLNFHRATIAFPQTPSPGARADICLTVSVQYFQASERQRFNCDWLKELSMGMSNGYHVPAEEEATIVRVDRALGGTRHA